MHTFIRSMIACSGAVLLCACGPQGGEGGSSIADRQDQALRHPFDYSPNGQNPDISGGGIGDFDSKALGKDLHDFLNP